MNDEVHSLTEDAPESKASWTKIFSLEALRYRGSGWWLDRALPSTPSGLLVIAFALPILWCGVGYAITPDRASYLDTHDITFQIPFLALHIITLRVIASLWTQGFGPALDGLGVDAKTQASARRGLFGPAVNAGALACAAYFIYRDTYMGLWPKLMPTQLDDGSWIPGQNAFDDPDMWDFGSLGRPVHGMMLGLWHFEWIIFGYLLWVQLWSLITFARAFKKTDFQPHLSRILIDNSYRPFFTLLGKTATVLLVFALGNLGFIYETGELFPRDVVVINGVGDVLEQMSDVLSITLLFALVLGGIVVSVRLLRAGLTRAVNTMFAEGADVALQELAGPLDLTGDAEKDVPALAQRVEAQSGVIRAIAFQREVDAMGSRTLLGVVLKAVAPMATAGFRVLKMKSGGGSSGGGQ